MKTLPLQDILAAIGGQIIHGSGNPLIEHATDYSKKDIDDHTLIFHMDHERIRGKYWKYNEGLALITDRPDLCTDLNDAIILIKTDDLEATYWKFIEYYRGLFDIPVIGVSGTCGKTTVKEMMKQILAPDYKVKATWMSMNSMSVNFRYVTGIDDKTEVAVFEMPVAYPGYLRVACRCFQPQIRILINIGVHHLKDSKTPEAYMKAKGEIVEGLDPVNGTLILNADDKNIASIVDKSNLQRVVYFGKGENCDFRADNVHYGEGGMNFSLFHGGQQFEVHVPGFGEHNVYNALAAIAGVSFVGIDIETAIKRLATFKQVKEHLEFKPGSNGSTVIDDSWNSAPLSMTAALQVLEDVSQGNKSIALLGYMPQLGKSEHALELYSEMGKKVVDCHIDLLIIVGEEANVIGESALQYGMDQDKVHFCTTGEEVYQVLQPHLQKETYILLKVTHRVMKKPSFQDLRKKLILVDNN